MSGDLTARDVMIRAHADARNVPFPSRKDEREVDAVLAALAAAGYTIVTTDTWEWGLRRRVGHIDGPVDEVLARRVQGYDGGTVVRRRPAGPWEVAP